MVHFFFMSRERGPERLRVNRLMVNRFAVVPVFFFRLVALPGVKLIVSCVLWIGLDSAGCSGMVGVVIVG